MKISIDGTTFESGTDLTKRELFTLVAMHAIIRKKPYCKSTSEEHSVNAAHLAKGAVSYANETLRYLEATK